MSSAITRRSRSDSGMSPDTIRWARPSTIAVLPTPGSPISTGLFLVRRERTWITRRISSSRPITGSSLPSSAACVRSRPKRSSAWYFSSGFWSVTRCGPRTDCDRGEDVVAPAGRRLDGLAGSASSRCSVEMYSSCSLPRLALGGAQDVEQLARRRGLAGARRDRGQTIELAADLAADGGRVGADLAEHGADDALVLVEQREQQVGGSGLGVAPVGRDADRRLERLL